MNSNTNVYSHESLTAKISKVLTYLITGQFVHYFKGLPKRIYSQTLSIGLRRDLQREFDTPSAAINLSIRPLQESGVKMLFKEDSSSHKFQELIKTRGELTQAPIPHCYMAVTEDNTPCYMQWLIGPQHNHLIQHFLGNSFPFLNQNEALLEGAFISSAFQDKGVVPDAMSQIALEANKMGVRWVLTFVELENTPVLRDCHRSGFSPYIIKKERWLFFYHQVSFEALTDAALQHFQQLTSDS